MNKPRCHPRVEDTFRIEEVESLDEVLAVLLLKSRGNRDPTEGGAEFEKDVLKCLSNSFINYVRGGEGILRCSRCRISGRDLSRQH